MTTKSGLIWSKEKKQCIFILLFFTFIVTFFCSKMSPFYDFQEWSDVNLYFNIGKAIMNGQVLYADTFDHKGPLIFLIYGIGYLMSHDTFLGVFFIEIVIWFVTVLCIFQIALFNFSNKIALLISCIFLSLYISHTSQGGSAEEFITCCIAISLFFFIKFFSFEQTSKLSKWNFIHGVMFGIVLFIKFNLVIFWVFPLLAVMLINKSRICNNILFFLSGFFIIALPILLYFIYHGALNNAIDSYILVNSSSLQFDFGDVLKRVFISFYQRLRFEPIEFGIILLGACFYPFTQFKSLSSKILFPFSFLSLFFMIFMGGYVLYYSIPYYIYAGLGIIVLFKLIDRLFTFSSIPSFMIYCLIGINLIFAVWRKDFFEKYKEPVKGNVVEVFLPHIINETDRSLVNLSLDEANALFTYANILPNVKYFISPNLSHDRYPQLRDTQTLYIRDKKTNFVVLAEYTNNAYYFSQLPELDENYEIVATFEEFYEWQNTYRNIYLYKRK